MNLFSIDGTLYRMLDKVVNFFFLNVLLILLCIPVVTIFPATVAMFGVVRQWVRKEELPVFKTYFTFFKENFKQSFVLGIIWFGFALLLYYNVTVSLQMAGILKLIMISTLITFCLFFIFISIFLLPVMVQYKMRFVSLIKNSLLFSVTQLKVTFLSLMIILLAMAITYLIPITIVFIWSFVAYSIYRLCDKAFKKVEVLARAN